jgi:hypothetical protein
MSPETFFVVYRPLLLALTFLAGIILQCVSILRKKPVKWQVIVFLGMLAYMSFMMGYSIFSYSPEYLEKNLLQAILPQIITIGMVFAFLFIMIFLKDVVTVIDEGVIYSLTLSFWFLIIVRSSSFNLSCFIFIIVLALIPTVGTVALLLHQGPIKNVYKFLFYGWYLLVNAVFAYVYFTSLPSEFFASGGLVVTGEEDFLLMLSMGMVMVYLVYNAGILYYAFIYSLMFAEVRKQLISYSEQLFGDKQISGREMKRITLFQVLIFAIFLAVPQGLRLYLISFWILLTPVILKVFFALRRAFRM